MLTLPAALLGSWMQLRLTPSMVFPFNYRRTGNIRKGNSRCICACYICDRIILNHQITDRFCRIQIEMDRGIGAAIWDRIGDPVKRIVFNGYIAKVRLASPRIRIDAVGIKYEPSDGRPRSIRKRSVRERPPSAPLPLFRTRKG